MLGWIYERRFKGCSWAFQGRIRGFGFSSAKARKVIRGSFGENRVSRLRAESDLLWRT
jgi:hypothetical protein